MNVLKGKKLILASASPRRKTLLEKLEIPFTVIPAGVNESVPAALPAEATAEFLAQQKARAIKARLKPGEIALTADTVVISAGQIMGKPGDPAHAKAMLRALSGKMHQVITGVCLTSLEKQVCFSAMSKVFFRELTDAEIDHYIENYQPFDKAGSYGIQEWIGHSAIERIEGSYNNIVGLPTDKLYAKLLEF